MSRRVSFVLAAGLSGSLFAALPGKAQEAPATVTAPSPAETQAEQLAVQRVEKLRQSALLMGLFRSMLGSSPTTPNRARSSGANNGPQ